MAGGLVARSRFLSLSRALASAMTGSEAIFGSFICGGTQSGAWASIGSG
jgi:hypothetical protein